MNSKTALFLCAVAAFALALVEARSGGDKIIIMPSKPKQQYYPIPIYYPTYQHGYGGHSDHSYGGYGGHSSYGGHDDSYGSHGGYDGHSSYGGHDDSHGSYGGYGGYEHMGGHSGGY